MKVPENLLDVNMNNISAPSFYEKISWNISIIMQIVKQNIKRL